jgi:hypothetical protein
MLRLVVFIIVYAFFSDKLRLVKGCFASLNVTKNSPINYGMGPYFLFSCITRCYLIKFST